MASTPSHTSRPSPGGGELTRLSAPSTGPQPESTTDDLRLGVDLGGTKTEAVVLRVRGSDFEVLARVRRPTERDLGYEHVVATTASLIAEARREAGLLALPPVGVGMPGNITMRNRDGTPSSVALVKNSNTTCLNGRPFRRDLEHSVGQRITFDNDANCFALAEAQLGAGRNHDAQVIFGVIMGTGVGGGIVWRRGNECATWPGHHGIAGEWGHVSLEPTSGPPCYCGRRGCIERYLSGPALEELYAARSSVRRPLAEIARLAETSGDHTAADVLDVAVKFFGRALAVVLNVLDPDLVVLGGGVSNLEVLTARGPREVARWLFNDELSTPIVRHVLGDSAGVFGAALIAGQSNHAAESSVTR